MASYDKIRVLVVDDSAVVRLMLSDLISRDDALELMDTAVNGRVALEKLAVALADVVVLDVEMPEMGGVETVAAIRQRYPRLPVIMFSSHTEEGAAVTIEALTKGAADYVTKPTGTNGTENALNSIREQLLPKIKAIGQSRRKPSVPTSQFGPDSAAVIRAEPSPNIELVCIAASTGGPSALETVLMALPASFLAPILIVQHMPPVFTRHLAQRLASRCAIRVREAQIGDTLLAGEALVAPGDFHLLAVRRGVGGSIKLTQEPPENSCRPSADVLFRSAVEAFGKHTLGVILTGMGQDGLVGCERIRAAGGQVLVQDEASSVVWGMPGAIARAGLAHKILPLEKIATDILRRVESGRNFSASSKT